jgi:homoserine O-acetyltransferase
LTQALGIDHCKLVLGVSMGGMLAWEWGVRYPDFMDCLVPLSALPTAMSGRNWILRRLVIDSIREDPRWQGGHYVEQPAGLRRAWAWFNAAANGGTLALQRLAPTREAADRWLDEALSRQLAMDANDYLYQMDASRDYDPSGQLHQIRARVLAILSDDDERCPAQMLREVLPSIRDGRMCVIAEGSETSGHATVNIARLWSDSLRSLLALNSAESPR